MRASTYERHKRSEPLEYPHVGRSRAVGVGAQAFGLNARSDVEAEWRSRSVQELVDVLGPFVEESGIAGVEWAFLDLEKELAHVAAVNWKPRPDGSPSAVDKTLSAMAQVMPGTKVLLWSTPFPPGKDGKLDRAFSDPEYLEWVRWSGVGFSPNLMVKTDSTVIPPLEEVVENARLSLSVFTRAEFPSHLIVPWFWHKYSVPDGHSTTNPTHLSADPELERQRAVLGLVESELGFDTDVVFWGATGAEEHRRTLAEHLEALGPVWEAEGEPPGDDEDLTPLLRELRAGFERVAKAIEGGREPLEGDEERARRYLTWLDDRLPELHDGGFELGSLAKPASRVGRLLRRLR